jgi:hypothetical protein
LHEGAWFIYRQPQGELENFRNLQNGFPAVSFSPEAAHPGN